ncbi:Pyrimidine pathway regulatory protein 1 [Candida viswanathii]|uniref:Pyrimidine pathway regulatory protein 1 n=1 Tax=Candida viswanathii TaxID=5486 RepID=A0A367YIX6_9ASCO|nr:Pyrimidine pathway regulatory protein 1 [Candida viswanathii]
MTEQPPKKKPKTTTTTTTSPSLADARISRTIAACKRCRSKKVKCDQEFPQCGKCKARGVECIGVDPVTGREIPRSYILHLEERVKMLESKLKLQGSAAGDAEGGGAGSGSGAGAGPGGSESTKSIATPLGLRGSIGNGFASLEDSGQPISFSKLMSTAVKVQQKTQEPLKIEVSNTQSEGEGQVLPAVLPPKSTALQFLQVFFHQCNSQIPLFHREEFLRDYFIPIYGHFDESLSLASNNTSINTSFFQHLYNNGQPCWFETYKNEIQETLAGEDASEIDIQKVSHRVIPPVKFRKPLYFLNLVFAVATSTHHLRYPVHISESFRLAAMKYSLDVEAMSDQLEHLQGILLYAHYSIMKPTNPGVWYIMGQALRICVDLDLQNEMKTKSKQNINIDSFTRDKRRRIFWCTYSIDRQICFYLDRPFGIPDESINTPYPSNLDDSKIIPRDVITDYSLADDVSYKNVSLAFFKIRNIQSQVTKILYTSGEVPRKYTDLNHWKQSILLELDHWKNELPNKTQMNCNFNPIFFYLNYHHTLLYIHGLSPKNYKLSLNDYQQLSNSAREVISCYTQLLHTKSINYTWAGVHNLFMAGTSYLYALYNSPEIRLSNPIDEVKTYTNNCLTVLQSFLGKCDVAGYCCEIFHNLTMVIFKLKYHEQELADFENSTTSSKVSRESLYRINNGNVHLNLFHLVTELDHLNPLVNSNNNLNLVKDHEEVSLGSDVSPPPIILQWNDEDVESFFKELNQPDPTASPANSREGKETFELLHAMPNEMIWGEFFTNK